jgi:uncharacterized protein (DUF488 family)
MDHGHSQSGLLLYSIGHSNHPLEKFLGLLTEHNIDVLVDVRSHPYSQYAPQFNREALRQTLQGTACKYLFLGEELGGRPDREDFYDADGRVLYNRVAESPEFLSGIRRVESGAAKYRVAMMCSEEDPLHCHRRLLVGRVLRARNVRLDHIRGDGRIQSEEELARAEQNGRAEQPSLFDDVGEPAEAEWKSIRSVSRRKARPSSSGSSDGPESSDSWTSD